jgi:hypothetical protein
MAGIFDLFVMLTACSGGAVPLAPVLAPEYVPATTAAMKRAALDGPGN